MSVVSALPQCHWRLFFLIQQPQIHIHRRYHQPPLPASNYYPTQYHRIMPLLFMDPISFRSSSLPQKQQRKLPIPFASHSNSSSSLFIVRNSRPKTVGGRGGVREHLCRTVQGRGHDITDMGPSHGQLEGRMLHSQRGELVYVSSKKKLQRTTKEQEIQRLLAMHRPVEIFAQLKALAEDPDSTCYIGERYRGEKGQVLGSLGAWEDLTRIAGVDEAGRGTIAGPVVAAACVYPNGTNMTPDPGTSSTKMPSLPLFEGLKDSKKMAPGVRKVVAENIRMYCDVGVGVASVEEIDHINILEATKLAIDRAVRDLKVPPQFLLIDGVFAVDSFEHGIPWYCVKGGDDLVDWISAASVIAKTTRDHLMMAEHEKFPMYGFHVHKGYCTKAHIEALKKFGPCPIHRKSFAPVKDLLST